METARLLSSTQLEIIHEMIAFDVFDFKTAIQGQISIASTPGDYSSIADQLHKELTKCESQRKCLPLRGIIEQFIISGPTNRRTGEKGPPMIFGLLLPESDMRLKADEQNF